MNTIIIISTIVLLFIIMIAIRKGTMNQITSSEAQKMITESNPPLLDVRSKEEFQSGHIKGAMHIPVSELNSRIGELQKYKETQMIVYCHSGGRSAAACQILKQSGFNNILNLAGGVSGWIGQGFSVTKS